MIRFPSVHLGLSQKVPIIYSLFPLRRLRLRYRQQSNSVPFLPRFRLPFSDARAFRYRFHGFDDPARLRGFPPLRGLQARPSVLLLQSLVSSFTSKALPRSAPQGLFFRSNGFDFRRRPRPLPRFRLVRLYATQKSIRFFHYPRRVRGR